MRHQSRLCTEQGISSRVGKVSTKTNDNTCFFTGMGKKGKIPSYKQLQYCSVYLFVATQFPHLGLVWVLGLVA